MKDAISTPMGDVASWLPRDGEMAERIRTHDWAATPLGPISEWPQSLRTAVGIMLASGHAMQLAWGLERTVLYNGAYAPMLGDRHPGALGLPFREAWPDIWEDVEPLVERVFAGEMVRFEDMPLVMTRHGYPEETWWTFSYSPVRDEAGAITGLLNVTVDATPKVRADRAEHALRVSEERQTFLLKLSDALRPLIDPTEIKNVATSLLGEQLTVNRLFYADADGDYWVVAKGYERDMEPLPDTPFEMATYGRWIIEDFKAGKHLIVSDMTTDTRFSTAERKEHLNLGIGAEIAVPLVKKGKMLAMLVAQVRDRRDWRRQDVVLLEEAAERTWSAVEWGRAEAAFRKSEKHAQTLLAELQHRVRNTLAVVRSIARRTADRSSDLDQMVSHFEGRLNAFSRVQSAVTRSPGKGVSIKEIISDEMLGIAVREGDQLKVSGPDVDLQPKPAESISLAIHELATNAVKYGAVTAPRGKIRVSWRTVLHNGIQELRFEWTETGLDQKPAPTREGFGHELLLRTLPYELDADTNITFTDDGLRFRMSMPLEPDVMAEQTAE